MASRSSGYLGIVIKFSALPSPIVEMEWGYKTKKFPICAKFDKMYVWTFLR